MNAQPESTPTLRITLVYAPGPRHVIEEQVTVTAPCTVAQVLSLSGWRQRYALDSTSNLAIAVWNHKVNLQVQLQDLDRVEICRGLRVDPKVARRERFQKQGAKAAGLFASRRPGAKPGY